MNGTASDPTAKQTVGANIRRARLQASMTQAQLAARLDVTRTRVSEYENGLFVDRIDRIAEIARITDAPSVGWFYDPHPEDEA